MNIQNQTLSYDLHYNPNDHHSCLNILTHITLLPLQRLPISLRIKLKVFAMTYKALHNLVAHYASELIAHTTLPLLLSVPEEMSYLLTFRLLHLLFFCLDAFLDMHMGQSFTNFRFCSNANLSVKISLAPSYSLALFYFSS